MAACEVDPTAAQDTTADAQQRPHPTEEATLLLPAGAALFQLRRVEEAVQAFDDTRAPADACWRSRTASLRPFAPPTTGSGIIADVRTLLAP